MAGKIPNEFIQDLIQRIDIVDLIDARVPLKKSGANYAARCPFHNEKSPSFTVSRNKQFFHCFGCGAHGNAISFLMDYERLSFVEAVEALAQQLGVDVPRDGGEIEQGPHQNSLNSLYDTQLQVAKFYSRQFKTHRDGGRAAEYLRSRGVTGEIAKEFMLGYAPDGWRSIPSSFANDQLEACGLLVRKEGGAAYDRFRNRVMFPIRDRRGRVVGFGGRVMGDELPKYLNSPETALFKKHRELYGLFEALKAVKKLERFLVVEGYMDVIALALHGIRYSVATLGTATSEDHISTLFRYVDEIVFCFDGDAAGQSAAWKALVATLPFLHDGKQAKFLILPDQEDPDSLVRKEGLAGFTARISESVPSSEFFWQSLTRGLDSGSIEDRSRLASQAEPLLRRIPLGMYRSMMFERMNAVVGMTVASNEKSTRLSRPTVRDSFRAERKPSTMRTIVTLLLNYPRFHRHLDANVSQYLRGHSRLGPLVSHLLEFIERFPDVSAGAVVESFRGSDLEQQISKFGKFDIVVPEEGVEQEFLGALDQLKVNIRNRRVAKLLRSASEGMLDSADREELAMLLREKTRVNSPNSH